MKHKLRLRERLQVQVKLDWRLMPGYLMSWKSWAFKLEGGVTLPNALFSNRVRPPNFPKDSKLGLDFDDAGNNQIRSRIFWPHVFVRICGLEAGAALFWRTRNEYDAPEVHQSKRRSE